MDLEHPIQPVVTVAAFDPLLDKIVSLQRSVNSKIHPERHELVGGKIESGDDSVEERLVLELRQEINATIASPPVHIESFGVVRESRGGLLVNRYVAPLPKDRMFSISPEEALEHPKFTWIDSNNFDTLDYVPGVRDFLHRLFAEFKRTGTLLSTLKQPVYVRPTFFDYEGERVLVPMEERKGGMPKHYLREEHLHLDEVIGSIVHEYLGEDRKQAKALRMRASSRQLI